VLQDILIAIFVSVGIQNISGHDIGIEEIQKHSNLLEDYFSQLINGGDPND
jgi:hypothetical protein